MVAAVDVEDCFYQTVNAFNLAEKYQTPVIFLTDQDMSVRVVTIPPFKLDQVKLEPRLLWDPAKADGEEYLRYKITDSGISPMSLPGMKDGQYTAEGLEKMESGAPEVRDRVHAAVSKRLRSILEAEEEIAKERPAVEIEAARHAIESVLRQLHDKGELESRAA